MAAHENHVVDVGHADAGILDRRAARRDRALDQVLDERLELGARELDVQVLRARRIGRHIRQVDVGLHAVRQLDLRLLGGFLQALEREHVLAEVDALLLLELADDVVDDPLIEVFAAQEGVAVRREHLELLFAVDIGDLDDRDVEGAATQVIDGDLAVAFLRLVEAEGERCCGRLVDDALDLEAGNAPGVLGGLALRVVEIRRHRDHGVDHRFAQIVFSGLLHLAQHFCADLRRRELLAAHFDPRVAVVRGHDLVGHQVDILLHLLLAELAADQALDGIDRVPRIGHRLSLGRRAHEDLAAFKVRNYRRRGARAFAVLDHLGRVAFHDGHARVRGAEVDADDLCHFR